MNWQLALCVSVKKYNKCQEKFTLDIFQALILFDFDPKGEEAYQQCLKKGYARMDHCNRALNDAIKSGSHGCHVWRVQMNWNLKISMSSLFVFMLDGESKVCLPASFLAFLTLAVFSALRIAGKSDPGNYQLWVPVFLFCISAFCAGFVTFYSISIWNYL